MLSSVNGLPVGPMTHAPSFRQRLASGMSAVTTMSSGCTCSTIQSSAASNPSATTSSASHPSLGTRIQELATKVTSRRYRLATRYTSCLTGQASASIKMCSKRRSSPSHRIRSGCHLTVGVSAASERWRGKCRRHRRAPLRVTGYPRLSAADASAADDRDTPDRMPTPIHSSVFSPTPR